MLDATFESVLGTVLVLGVVFAHIDHRDFPNPAVDIVIAGFGFALIGLAVALAQVVARDAVTDAFLRALAATNTGFALLMLAWLLIGDGFSEGGKAIVWVIVVGLLLLALMQVREIGRPDRTAPGRPVEQPPPD